MDLSENDLIDYLNGNAQSFNQIEHAIKRYYSTRENMARFPSDSPHYQRLMNLFDACSETMNKIRASLDCNRSNPNALYLFGYIHQKEGNMDEAISYYAEAVKGGSIKAMLKLSSHYESSHNLRKSFELHYALIKLYKGNPAQDVKGYSECLHNLAEMYAKGLGCEQNMPKAIQYYKSSVKLGNPPAAYELGKIYKSLGNRNKSQKYYLQANDIYYPSREEMNDLIIYTQDLRAQVKELKAENHALSEKVQRQKQKLLYTPGCKGYDEAKADFEKLATSS